MLIKSNPLLKMTITNVKWRERYFSYGKLKTKFWKTDEWKKTSNEQYKEFILMDLDSGIIKWYQQNPQNCLPSFWTYLGGFGTHCKHKYKFASFLVRLLPPPRANKYIIKDSFAFPEDLQNFNSKTVMTSFDKESLSTNILDLCWKSIYR